MNKVILISVDGMRPDGFLTCKNPYIEQMMQKSYYTLDGKTVLPSVTLPCHMSLFHSVPPQRHGITTNQKDRGRFCVFICQRVSSPKNGGYSNRAGG